MKNFLFTMAVAVVVLLAGCKKDDFVPVIGVCPVVLSTNPANNSTGVPLNSVLRVTFNIRMDPASINQGSFTLRSTSPIAGVITHTDSTATFTPSGLLTPNTTYTGTISTLVKDITGNAMQQNYVWTFVSGPSPIEFNTLSQFGVFASDGIVNGGNTQIFNLDIGVSGSNRSSITGFPPGEVVNGGIFALDDAFPPGVPAMLAQAKADFESAYLLGSGLLSPAKVLISGDQGGRTLIPGIYQTNGDMQIAAGNLILDARGDTNAVWIFQVGGNLSSLGNQGGDVVLANGAQANNVFWLIADSVSLGAGTNFYGNALAINSISVNPGANATGRFLSKEGTVFLNSNIINKP
jgi:hypothetical protein